MQAVLGRFIATLGVVLAAGCGSGSGSGSSDGGPAVPPVADGPQLGVLNPQAFNLEVNQGGTTQASLSFSNVGDQTLTYGLADAPLVTLSGNVSGSLAASQSVTIGVQVTCSGADASTELVLTTNDSNAASQNIPVNITCLAPAAYAVERVLLNQAARSFDSDVGTAPSIGLLSGRDLLVRAFVTGSGPVPDAEVVISTAGQADQVLAMQVPPTVGESPATDTILSASHYVIVPGSLVQTNSQLQVRVEGASFPASGMLDLAISDPGRFEITFVPVTFNGQTPSIDADDYLRQTLQQMPIGEYHAVVRAPYNFTGEFDLDALLDEMVDLRTLDGSTRLYHGVIIPPNFNSQTAGIGFVGFPVSVSIDLNGSQNVISHEIGHNLDLGHAPGCDAPDADPDFPYANADVTSWGFDILNQALVAPTATRQDLMSYCQDLWISDYNFNKALEYRVASPIGSTGQAGLLVRGRVIDGRIEAVSLLPVEAARMPVSRADNTPDSYEFRAWDASGQLLVLSRFSAHAIPEGNGAGFSFVAPTGAQAVRHLQISRGGATVYSEDLGGSGVGGISVAVDWDATTANLSWQPQRHAALIVRNPSNQVVAIGRRGSLVLPADRGPYSLSVAQNGRVGAMQVLPARRDQVLMFAN